MIFGTLPAGFCCGSSINISAYTYKSVKQSISTVLLGNRMFFAVCIILSIWGNIFKKLFCWASYLGSVFMSLGLWDYYWSELSVETEGLEFTSSASLVTDRYCDERFHLLHLLSYFCHFPSLPEMWATLQFVFFLFDAIFFLMYSSCLNSFNNFFMTNDLQFLWFLFYAEHLIMLRNFFDVTSADLLCTGIKLFCCVTKELKAVFLEIVSQMK